MNGVWGRIRSRVLAPPPFTFADRQEQLAEFARGARLLAAALAATCEHEAEWYAACAADADAVIAAGQLDRATLTRLATGLPPVVSGLPPEPWHEEVRRLETHLASVALNLRTHGPQRG